MSNVCQVASLSLFSLWASTFAVLKQICSSLKRFKTGNSNRFSVTASFSANPAIWCTHWSGQLVDAHKAHSLAQKPFHKKTLGNIWRLFNGEHTERIGTKRMIPTIFLVRWRPSSALVAHSQSQSFGDKFWDFLSENLLLETFYRKLSNLEVPIFGKIDNRPLSQFRSHWITLHTEQIGIFQAINRRRLDANLLAVWQMSNRSHHKRTGSFQ